MNTNLPLVRSLAQSHLAPTLLGQMSLSGLTQQVQDLYPNIQESLWFQHDGALSVNQIFGQKSIGNIKEILSGSSAAALKQKAWGHEVHASATPMDNQATITVDDSPVANTADQQFNAVVTGLMILLGVGSIILLRGFAKQNLDPKKRQQELEKKVKEKYPESEFMERFKKIIGEEIFAFLPSEVIEHGSDAKIQHSTQAYFVFGFYKEIAEFLEQNATDFDLGDAEQRIAEGNAFTFYSKILFTKQILEMKLLEYVDKRKGHYESWDEQTQLIKMYHDRSLFRHYEELISVLPEASHGNLKWFFDLYEEFKPQYRKFGLV